MGAAATLGALFRAPLTSSMLMFELTQNHDIVLPVLVSTGIYSVKFVYSYYQYGLFVCRQGWEGSLQSCSVNRGDFGKVFKARYLAQSSIILIWTVRLGYRWWIFSFTVYFATNILKIQQTRVKLYNDMMCILDTRQQKNGSGFPRELTLLLGLKIVYLHLFTCLKE